MSVNKHQCRQLLLSGAHTQHCQSRYAHVTVMLTKQRIAISALLMLHTCSYALLFSNVAAETLLCKSRIK